MVGYQERDREVVDYRLWMLDGFSLRGPRPQTLEPRGYVACVGAAQTFGPLCERPYPRILEEQLGLPVLNLGFAGAGPRFFTERPRLMALIGAAKLAIIQVMSGRSEDNSIFSSAGGERLLRRSDGAVLGAEPAYADLIRSRPADDVMRVVSETRLRWVDSYRRLFRALEIPTILLYASRRPPHYETSPRSVHALFGPFPHLVDEPTLAAVRPLASRYVESVSTRGDPHLLRSRFTGEEVSVTGRADLGSRIMRVNTYYPTPEMHEDAADALAPAARELLAVPMAGP